MDGPASLAQVMPRDRARPFGTTALKTRLRCVASLRCEIEGLLFRENTHIFFGPRYRILTLRSYFIQMLALFG
jgi:hypothetical protein